MLPEPQSQMFTRKELRIRLKIGLTKVDELISSGSIRSVKIGRARRIPADAVDEYLRSIRAGF